MTLSPPPAPAQPRERIEYGEWIAGGVAAGLIVVGILSIVLIVGRRGESETIGGVAGNERCGPIQELPNEGVEHLPEGVSPPAYATRPAASGIHTDAALPPDVRVYTEPVPEETAIHNLEHAYVLIYYRADGPGALPPNVVDALANLAQGQDKVIMAPYPALNAGINLALVAWQRLRECAVADDTDAAVEVASSFISEFRGGGVAPESSGA